MSHTILTGNRRAFLSGAGALFATSAAASPATPPNSVRREMLAHTDS